MAGARQARSEGGFIRRAESIEFRAPEPGQRFFNTGGPAEPSRHYVVPAVDRIPFARQMVEDGLYFAIKAPYRSGKTTLANELAREMEIDGRFRVLRLNFHELKGANGLGALTVCFFEVLKEALENSGDPVLSGVRFGNAKKPPRGAVKEILGELCLALDKPLVLLIDEIHAIPRKRARFFFDVFFAGFQERTRHRFPHSVVFFCVRDVFAPTARAKKGGSRNRGVRGGALNIYRTVELPNLTFADICSLCDAHNAETGQFVDDEAKLKIWDLTEGQPFLVNAILGEALDFVLHGETAKPVTGQVVAEAALGVARSRPAHLVRLMSFLKDPGVLKAVGEVLSGVSAKRPLFDEGTNLALDLGLLSLDGDDYLRPANRFVKDLALGALTEHMALPGSLAGRFREGDEILASPLILEFQRYWKERAGTWLKPFGEIPGALTRLALMAFLRRALGDDPAPETFPAVREDSLMIAVRRESKTYPIFATLGGASAPFREPEELSSFMDSRGASEGWVLSFDLDGLKSPEEKCRWKTLSLPRGKTVHLVGL